MTMIQQHSELQANEWHQRRSYRSVRASIARREKTDRSRGAAKSTNALTFGIDMRPFGVSKWTGTGGCSAFARTTCNSPRLTDSAT